MEIIFDFEGRDEGAAFFALFAGLKMYMSVKSVEFEVKNKGKEESERVLSIPSAEAYCMLQDLKEQHPKEFAEAEAEYKENY